MATQTRGLLHADIRTRIEEQLDTHPNQDVVTFSIERGELSVDDVSLVNQAIYESARDIDGVAFVTVVVDGNDDRYISIRIHRKI